VSKPTTGSRSRCAPRPEELGNRFGILPRLILQENSRDVIDFTAFMAPRDFLGETIPAVLFGTAPIDNKRPATTRSGHRADPAAEAVMRRLFDQANFPSTGIRGEGKGIRQRAQDAEYVWVLDPIDGTKSFISGFRSGAR